jgi:hypothetical protein
VCGYAKVQCRDKTVLGKDSSELRRSMEDSQNDSGDGFWVSSACVNIAKDEYRGHIIHRNTPVDFWFWFFNDYVTGKLSKGRSQTQTVQTVDDRMEDEPPSRLNSWVKFHVPRLTHVSHEVAFPPSSTCSLFAHVGAACVAPPRT